MAVEAVAYGNTYFFIIIVIIIIIIITIIIITPFIKHKWKKTFCLEPEVGTGVLKSKGRIQKT